MVRSVLVLMLLVCGAARAEVAVLTTGAFKAVAVAVAGPFEAAGQPVRITNDNLGSLYAEPASPDSPKGVQTNRARPGHNVEASDDRAAAT